MYLSINNIIKTVIVCGVMGVFTSACSKNDYFINSGKHDREFDGSVLQYLESKPLFFDTLLDVIHLAGMDKVFREDSVTFFAPVDYSIVSSVTSLNNYLRINGRDTVNSLEQISGDTWKKMLSLYMFKGVYHQKDFPQIDTTNLLAYPGQNYESYDGRPMNIGVIYHNANGDDDDNGGVKYAGYRQLLLSYITNFAEPQKGNIRVLVSSSDIAPKNGVVHVLQFTNHYFGFDTTQFIISAVDNGINIK